MDVENKPMDTKVQKRTGLNWEMGINIYIYIYIYTHTYTYKYIHICVCVCVCVCVYYYEPFLVAQTIKNLPAVQETWV